MTALLKPDRESTAGRLLLDMPAELYHRHPAISRSNAQKILRSPAHYQHALTNPTEETEAMALGTKIHSALLERERFWPTTAIWSGGRRYGKEWDAFRIRHEGKTILTVEEESQLLHITEVFDAHPLAQKMANAVVEASLFWQCPRTGLELKARLDAYVGDTVYDIKSTWSAATEDFEESIQEYRYYRQAAWYSDGFEAVLGRRPKRFIFVAIETRPPFGIHPFVLDNSYLKEGAEDNARALDLIAHHTALGEWPGYDEEPTVIYPPRGAELAGETEDE